MSPVLLVLALAVQDTVVLKPLVVTANRVPATSRALQRAEARRQNRTGSSVWGAARAMHRGTGHRVRARGRCARCSCQGLKPPRSMGQFRLPLTAARALPEGG